MLIKELPSINCSSKEIIFNDKKIGYNKILKGLCINNLIKSRDSDIFPFK